MPAHYPANGQTVWCRLWHFAFQPFQAVYDSSLYQFTAVLGGKIRDWTSIARWRTL